MVGAVTFAFAEECGVLIHLQYRNNSVTRRVEVLVDTKSDQRH